MNRLLKNKDRDWEKQDEKKKIENLNTQPRKRKQRRKVMNYGVRFHALESLVCGQWHFSKEILHTASCPKSSNAWKEDGRNRRKEKDLR